MSPNLQRLLALSTMSGALFLAGCTTTTAADRHDHAAHQAAAAGAQAKTAGAEMYPMHAQGGHAMKHGSGAGTMAQGAMGMCPMHAQMQGGQHGEMHGKMHGQMHGQMHGKMQGQMHGQMHGNKSDAKSPADRRAMIERHMQAMSPEQKQQRIKMMESQMALMQQDIQMMRDHMNKPASAK